ncbi:MAG TPA: YqgE/AlgH family protein [Methylophaga sp.]|nr:YqgE/AlgH family protein [Methylophaga sp.]
MMTSFFKNHFLVAMPSLIDSFFYHSVIYLCEHDENGAMGIIINRPTRIKLSELLGHLHIDNNNDWVQNRTVLFGGPVKKDQGMVLHDGGAHWKSTMTVADDLFLTTSSDILSVLGSSQGPQNALITLGYAGWGEGQLEQELAENSWLTVPASSGLLFDTPAEQRWEASAKLLGIDIHLMSNNAGHA